MSILSYKYNYCTHSLLLGDISFLLTVVQDKKNSVMKCDSWSSGLVWSSQLFYSELPQYVLETIFGAKMEMFKSVTNITM